MSNQKHSAPHVSIITKHPWRPTEAFDTYWRLAYERQEIFFRRHAKVEPPYTDDQILYKYKFTNAYRASDRVSQYLIREVIYSGDYSPEDILFRILLFKIFNRISTWQRIQSELGEVCWRKFNFDTYDRVLSTILSNGKPIYSAAYMMASGRSRFGHERKHRNHLRLIEMVLAEGFAGELARCRSMQQVFGLLRGFPTIGDFLAYQYAIDINYSLLTDFSESEFVCPGPGARDGIRKCFSDFGGLSEPELIRVMADRQESDFERLGLDFKNLWGRRLQLIDCQNLFCETDKYSRVAHPDIQGLSGRQRIKQKFSRTGPLPEPLYPPKWGINEEVKKGEF